ncbi:MAG TPA: hypothetical protein VK179_14895 [Bacteroidales bacterium]|nr:hypothetical protein [Bacteroidales bacterium]
MAQNKEPIQQLNEIRDLMERSSRFISLSGLSGISAGIIALIGTVAVYIYLDYNLEFFNLRDFEPGDYRWLYILAGALVVLVVALIAAVFFTTRRARSKGLKVWDRTARRLVINLCLPLATGGIFCGLLAYYGLFFLILPSTLIYYGLALLNAGKYTFNEIRLLGIFETVLGLISGFLPDYALLIWAFGFGFLHIVYGSFMYNRYEKSES